MISFSTRPEALTRLCAALMLGVLLSAITFGCSQSPRESAGDEAGDRQATTQAGTTLQRETVASGEATQGPSQRQRQKAQEQAQRQQEQAEQQRQQAQQQSQQQGQQQQAQQGGQRQNITVRVTGTAGVSFSGRIGSAQEMRRVEGSVPKEYELPFGGAALTAALRKQEPGDGTLGIEVLLEGELVASRETSTTPGVLNLVWTPR